MQVLEKCTFPRFNKKNVHIQNIQRTWNTSCRIHLDTADLHSTDQLDVVVRLAKLQVVEWQHHLQQQVDPHAEEWEYSWLCRCCEAWPHTWIILPILKGRLMRTSLCRTSKRRLSCPIPRSTTLCVLLWAQKRKIQMIMIVTNKYLWTIKHWYIHYLPYQSCM